MPNEPLALLVMSFSVFLIFFFLAVELEVLLFWICDFLNHKAWDAFFSIPTKLYHATLGKLFSWIANALLKTGIGRLDHSLSAKGFGGVGPLVWATASLIYIIVQLICTPSAGQDLIMNLLTGTAIGAPVAFLIGEVSLSLPTIIGAGFTRVLSMESMRQRGDGPESTDHAAPQSSKEPRREMHLLVKCLYGVIFLGAFGLLGSAMSGIFETISSTILSLINKFESLSLFAGTAGFWDWFYLIIGAVGFIVVGYLWLLLLFMAFKEYLSNFSYCLLPLSVLMLTLSILSAFGLDKLDWLAGVLLVISLLFGEWHRYQMENEPAKRKQYEHFMGRFRIFSNHILPWLRKRIVRSLCPCSPCSIFRRFR